MRDHGITVKRRRKFKATTDSKHPHPIALNRLRREFSAHAPNALWVTDVTCVWTAQGWLYLASIIDLCSRRVVGWAPRKSNNRYRALEALRMAVRARKPARGLVHHSDRGSPYASDHHRAALRAHGMVASMSRKGDCWDNAVAESFFATLKSDLCRRVSYATRAAAARSNAEYIESVYTP